MVKHGTVSRRKWRKWNRGILYRNTGMDYNETYSPIVRLETIHTIIAQAVKENWEIQQMDVKGAYLNGILKEEVYMTQPEGFSDGTWRLCWLIKTLYGLKQLGCEWNEEFNQKLIQQDFTRLHSDPCVYIRHKTGNIEIITVWVDDLLLFTNTPDIMRHLLHGLRNQISSSAHSSVVWGHIEFQRLLEGRHQAKACGSWAPIVIKSGGYVLRSPRVS